MIMNTDTKKLSFEAFSIIPTPSLTGSALYP